MQNVKANSDLLWLGVRNKAYKFRFEFGSTRNSQTLLTPRVASENTFNTTIYRI